MSARTTTVEHECPCCGSDVPVDYEQSPKHVRCPNCNALLNVDYDADLDDGAWRDLTKLIEA